MEVQLPINMSFLPVTIQLDRAESDLMEECREWVNKLIRVDSPDQLPEDPIGFPDLYRDLDYKDKTLLIYYDRHFWQIKTCDFKFRRNTVEKNYNWAITLGVVDIIFEGDEVPDSMYFTRFAILVRKLPEDAEILTWNSIADLDHNNDWTES